MTITNGMWNNTSQLYVGSSGTGALNINGGTVTSSAGFLGNYAGSNGTVTATSGTWTNASSLYIGNAGTGTLNINGGTVTNGYECVLGGLDYARGTVNVTSGTWTNAGSLSVGYYYNSVGTMNISGGGVTTGKGVLIGGASSAVGTVDVTGGIWKITGDLVVGYVGTGTLTISDGAVTTSGTLLIAQYAGSHGTLNYTGGTLNASCVTVGRGTAVINFNNSGSYTFASSLTGTLNVNQLGAGTTTLTGSNTYTGTTTVAAGTFSLPNPCLASTANVNLRTGGILNLNFTGSNTVSALQINGVAQSPGTWGGVASSATYKTALITGAGVLNVTNGPAQQPYASWAAAHNLDNTPGLQNGYSDTPAADRIPNGLKWILGGKPLANSTAQLPQFTADADNFVFTFTRNSASASAATLVVEWGSDLAGWTAVPIGATSSGPDAHGVTVTVTANGDAPDTVVVTIPRSNAATGKLFARLKATMP